MVALLDGFEVDGSEPGGSFCLMRAGEVAVEHHVGTRDGTTPWDVDTLVLTYSVAKPFAALAVLAVVADGGLDLDEPVGEAWPEYAAHGKAGTTVRHVLSHQAGLPCFPDEAVRVPYDDLAALTDLLAGAVPVHEPGAGVAEHALTYGHLCDALVRRITGEGLAERFGRIADENSWDLHLRVSPADLPRVADVVAPDSSWAGDYLDDPRWGPALGRPSGLLDPSVLNSERFRTTSFPAIAMHATARGLARFYADLLPADGPVATLLGRDLHAEYVAPQATGHDLVLDREVTWTLGFQIDDDDIGMGGAGGCSAWYSLRGEYAAAYVTRGLGGHERGDALWELAEQAIRT